jgi:hypothetical protein
MISEDKESLADADWTLTTWEGARREQLRRWADLPLERIIMALEEMGELAERIKGASDRDAAH